MKSVDRSWLASVRRSMAGDCRAVRRRNVIRTVDLTIDLVHVLMSHPRLDILQIQDARAQTPIALIFLEA